MCLVEPEVNWRSETLVFSDTVTFSQGSKKHKKGLHFEKKKKNTKKCKVYKAQVMRAKGRKQNEIN